MPLFRIPLHGVLRPAVRCRAVHPSVLVRCDKRAGHVDAHRWMSDDAQDSEQWHDGEAA